MINHSGIKIFTTQMSISSSCFNFKDTIFNSQKTDIKSTTTKIKNKNVLFTSTFFIKTISNGSSSRFIDDSLNLKTSNSSSIFGCLSLSIIKISRDGNNSRFNSSSQIRFSNLFHFL
mmetsp:Transcript_3890/g.5726  ORF Transcript_3890/g.5726 Transcript_3890/m.5726 type:complete len:117 (+) Transcript_3890:976-1326(+)